MKYKFMSRVIYSAAAILMIFFFNLSYGETNGNYIKGLKYYSEMKFLSAIGSFNKAIEEGEKDPKIYFLLGNSYANIEDYDRALDKYNSSLELTSDGLFQSVITHNIGYVYFLKKDYKSSIDYLSRAYLMNTNLVQAFWFKGMAYYKLKDKPDTIKEWEGYLDRAPQGPQSENIRKALAILKSDSFNFERDKLFPQDNQTTVSNKGPNVEPLIDIEGVLDQLKPVDKGKASDTQVEEIEK